MLDDRPLTDYENLPYLPREGIQRANNRFATASLFLETADSDKEDQALWCLSEHEIFANGKWYLSAQMVYIYATDEYDALRKICGNVRQWEYIKKMYLQNKMGTFEEKMLPDWQLEQAYVQRSRLRATLFDAAKGERTGYTAAAKMLLQMIDAPMKGRPKKEKKDKPDPKDDDGERVLQFRP